MKLPRSDDSLCCSFCRKPEGIVGKLISNPSDYPRAYICDECIMVCNYILGDDRAEKGELTALAGLKHAIGELRDEERMALTIWLNAEATRAADSRLRPT